MSEKPREWTIDQGLQLHERPGGPPDNSFRLFASGPFLNGIGDKVHVIEKSAYDKLESEVAEARADLAKHETVCAQYSELVDLRNRLTHQRESHNKRIIEKDEEIAELGQEIERLHFKRNVMSPSSMFHRIAQDEKIHQLRAALQRVADSFLGEHEMRMIAKEALK